jgi:SAM-dependent methyltransferase
MNYFQSNLKLWNELVEINKDSGLYRLDEFKMGKNVLKPVEIAELTDVKDKELLHLQCHFGMDTLSWARLGAKVTGIDFSDKAIELAKSISKEINIEAEFIQSNIYDLQNVLNKKFDVVFTSYGAVCWLNDINKWGEIAAHYLKPGGTFYMVEFHPLLNIFDNETDTKDLFVNHGYFFNDEPLKWEPGGAYADRTKITKNPSYEWIHSLSDIINSLIKAGLEIEFVHEFPYCCYSYFPFMEKREDGMWNIKGLKNELPMMFSIKAQKR